MGLAEEMVPLGIPYFADSGLVPRIVHFGMNLHPVAFGHHTARDHNEIARPALPPTLLPINIFNQLSCLLKVHAALLLFSDTTLTGSCVVINSAMRWECARLT